MGKRAKKAAYVVFIGRNCGIYDRWSECESQIHGWPNNSYKGYETYAEAQQAWEGHLRATIPSIPSAGYDAVVSHSPYKPVLYNPQEHRNSSKRSLDQTIDLPVSDGEQAAHKRQKSVTGIFQNVVDTAQTSPSYAATALGLGSRESLDTMDSTPIQDAVEMEDDGGVPVELTEAQQTVVDMAVKKHNIFLTGAAGSGKSVTLKEIIKQLNKHHRSKPNCPAVQVVAPTGIAALPLSGKTTYSFAGWNPDSLQLPMYELLERTKKSVREAIEGLKVLIVEEISMVENQFLERLNRLFQHVLISNEPFGGKQVILVGDFHQLPPVKPFQYCLECGEPMVNKQGYRCEVKKFRRCDQSQFVEGDKWAFKAPVWKTLKLRHVKLEQIHRQKDTRFQDVLNKIRNGLALENQEWDDLERPKELPPRAFPVRLMSRLADVRRFNEMELSKLKVEAKCWVASDTCVKKHPGEADKFPPRSYQIAAKIKEFREALRDHRFPTELKLKVGAKVVLLYNLNPRGGLVNGSQGQVVGFANTEKWPKKMDDSRWKIERFAEFAGKNGHWQPIVRFTNGKTLAIPQVVQDATKHFGEDRYLVSRTQVPLTLAWALSIHKSQGMTLQHAEVSSRYLFESGQFYVGVSRVTTLEGLIVTGYSREQTLMDPDVLEFYKTSKWESLGPTNVSTSSVTSIEQGAEAIRQSSSIDRDAKGASPTPSYGHNPSVPYTSPSVYTDEMRIYPTPSTSLDEQGWDVIPSIGRDRKISYPSLPIQYPALPEVEADIAPKNAREPKVYRAPPVVVKILDSDDEG